MARKQSRRASLGCKGTARAGAAGQRKLRRFSPGLAQSGSGRAVPGACPAAAQRGSSSWAGFSRKGWGCQLRPSLQLELLTRGQGRAAAWRRELPVFSPKDEPAAGAPPVRRCPPGSGAGLQPRREGAALPGCEAVAEMGHFLRGCRSPGPGGFDRGANIWGQIYIK